MASRKPLAGGDPAGYQLAEAQADIKTKWRLYKHLAAMPAE